MTRSLKIYQGEDLSPVTDLTDMVEWPDCEFGQRAWFGEGVQSTIRLRDENGVTGNFAGLPAGLTPISIAAHNVVVWLEGSNTMARQRVSPKDYTRGEQVAGRAREAQVTTDDYNVDLHNIIIHNYSRPAETDVARVQGILASYLSGSPRRTTNLNGSNYVSSSNTVSMPAQTYDRSTVDEVLSSIAGFANKTYFVTIDAELFYDGNDSTAYRCPLRISDRPEEVDHNLTWEPIWDMGAASTEDGQQLLSGVWLFYGESQYVHVSDATVANLYSWWEDIIYDDEVTTASAATTRANAILARRKYEERNYNVSIGPLTRAQIGSIKPGMLIDIKARAIPDADDAYVSRRIAELRWTTPEPERWFAHMHLDRPLRGAYGQGPKADTIIPKPAPVCETPAADTVLADWDWSTCANQGGTDSCTGLPFTNAVGTLVTTWTAGGCRTTQTGAAYTNKVAVTAGTVITVTLVAGKYGGPDGQTDTFKARFFGIADCNAVISTSSSTFQTGYWSHEGGDHGNWRTASFTFTVPTGAGHVAFTSSFFGFWQRLTVSIPVDSPPCDDYAVTDPGSSPYYARSDDPRFTNPDQHVTSRLSRTMTNISGGDLTTGAVVIASGQNAFTTTSTANYSAGMVGILMEDIASNADGVVLWAGVGSQEIPDLTGTPAAGDFIYTSTTPGQATTSATRSGGAVGKVIEVTSSQATFVEWWGIPDESSTSAAPSIGTPGSASNVITTGGYVSFPILERLTTGSLIMVYRRGTDHNVTNDGIAYRRISTDNGATWGSEGTVYDHASLNVNPQAVKVLRNGTVIVAYCTQDGNTVSDNFIGYTIKSTDDGATWGSPVATGTTYGTGANHREIPCSIVELADNTLLMAFFVRTNGASRDKVVAFTSSDGGATWGGEVTIVSDGADSYSECEIRLLDDGSILALLRNDTDKDIYYSVSEDRGATWSTHTLAFSGWGFPHFRQLRSGALLVTYRLDNGTSSGRAVYRVSYDRGATWSAEANLETTATAMQYADAISYVGSPEVRIVYSLENSSTDADILTLTLNDIDDVRYNLGDAASSGPPGVTYGTPALTLGTANAAGSTDEAIRRDATILAFDATVPVTQAFSDAAATGSATVAARRDHRHGMPAPSGIGEILISDTPSTPLIFADLIQNEAQDDLVYADP